MNIFIGQTENTGKGIFTKSVIKKGQFVVKFEGELYTLKQLQESKVQNLSDYSMQIGKDVYLGPGGILNYINHSCNPNCWVKIVNTSALLFALKNIQEKEQLTYDYSSTMDEDSWELVECKCGSKKCRHRIRDFKYLPKNLQEGYIKKGVIPDYILQGLTKKKN